MIKKSTKKAKVKGRPKNTGEIKKNPNNLDTLSKRLVKETSNVDIRDLSERTNINYKTLNAFINGNRIPKIDDLISISRELKVPIDYLLGLQEQKSLDIEVREIAKKIGISEKSINILKNENDKYFKKTIDYLVSKKEGREVVETINNYIYYLPITNNIVYQIYDWNINNDKIYEHIDYEDFENIKIIKINEKIKRLKVNIDEYKDNLLLQKEDIEEQIKEEENKSKKDENYLENLYGELDEVIEEIKRFNSDNKEGKNGKK